VDSESTVIGIDSNFCRTNTDEKPPAAACTLSSLQGEAHEKRKHEVERKASSKASSKAATGQLQKALLVQPEHRQVLLLLPRWP